MADRRSQLMTGALFGGGILAAAGIAGAFEALFASPAFASSATDVQILQTASSIEVLAVATYKTALTLPFIGGSSANPVVKTFATTTMQQHSQHLSAFNAAITGLGGKPQTNPDPVLGKVVQAAVPGLTSPGPGGGAGPRAGAGGGGDLCGRRRRPERRQRQEGHRVDHGGGSPACVDPSGRAGVAGRKCPQLIALPPDAGSLPAAAGSVGFPDAFYPTQQARPATEGALS